MLGMMQTSCPSVSEVNKYKCIHVCMCASAMAERHILNLCAIRFHLRPQVVKCGSEITLRADEVRK